MGGTKQIIDACREDAKKLAAEGGVIAAYRFMPGSRNAQGFGILYFNSGKKMERLFWYSVADFPHTMVIVRCTDGVVLKLPRDFEPVSDFCAAMRADLARREAAEADRLERETHALEMFAAEAEGYEFDWDKEESERAQVVDDAVREAVETLR